jgi:parvulin-like peptidyl-prolyl isomerase
MLATSPRLLLTLPVALASLALAAACGSGPESSAPAPASESAWAVVDGREILREEVERAYRLVADPANTPSEEEAMLAKLSLLDGLITQELLIAEAERLGIEVTPPEVDAAYNERKQGIADDAFLAQLTQRGLAPADMRESLRSELAAQKVLEREVSSKVNVSEQAVVDHYNANREQFNLSEPAYRIAQIVITPGREDQVTNRQNDDATTPAAAAGKAKMLMDRLRAGADFSELAMDYSEDPQSALVGGDLGFLPASQLQQAPAPLRNAVLAAEPGAVSQVSADGAHALVLLVAKEAAGQRSLSSPGVRENISTMLRDRQEQLLRAAYLTVLRTDADIVNHLARQIVAQPATPPPAAPAAPAAPSLPGGK